MSIARKVIIPQATLIEPCAKSDQDALPWQDDKDNKPKFYIRPAARPLKHGKRTDTYSWNLFPVVVDSNSKLWPEASLYILDRIMGEVGPSMQTYHTIAEDLAIYKRWLEEEDVDFKHFPIKKLERPTYRFRGHLVLKAHAREVAFGSANRIMGTVVKFYRWLSDELDLVFTNPPWQESDSYISINDKKGFIRNKRIKITDLRVHVPQQRDPYAGTIDDGGKLRPLQIKEQIVLLKALKKLDNTEMSLIHLVALATGARIQTVLTLRVKHARLDVPEGVTEVALAVGHGEGIDTKYGKQGSIFIPIKLYKKLCIYSHSERAQARRKKAGTINEEDQYLFLSSQGSPMYRSKQDRDEFDSTLSIRHEKVGQTVRQYIKEMVLPTIRAISDEPFHYRFHDLRATFGMNLTDAMQLKVQRKQMTPNAARELVKFRLMHDSAATTDLYLNYRGNLKHLRESQKAYEAHLAELTKLAMELVS